MTQIYLFLVIFILLLIIIFLIFRLVKFELISTILFFVILFIIIFEITLIAGRETLIKNNDIQKNMIIELNKKYITPQQIPNTSISNEEIYLMNTIKYTSDFTPVYSELEILENGDKTFESLFEAIENAKHHIHIQDFIIRDDEVGQRLIDLIFKKAHQGVKIRIMIDGMGAKVKKATLNKLRESGVMVYVANPIIKSILNGKINNRDHRKIFIIDGMVAYTGGVNIGKEYAGKDPRIGFWRDTNIRIKGDAVKQLQCIFISSWYLNTRYKIDEKLYFPDSNEGYTELCQTINSLPEGDSSAIEHVYINMISQASKEINITTPYLILNEKTYNALVSAKLRGVDIKIVIPPYSNNIVVQKSTIYYAGKLARKGIKVYIYPKGFIHSKIIIVDQNIASIGTANFNNRSMNLDYENSLIIYDDKLVEELNSQFYNDIKDNKLLNLSDIKNNGFIGNLFEKFCIIFSPIQ